MYEKHFKLNKRPFRANADGTDVFVGPQIAATMASLKKGLTAADAIITISGPTGSGKTTLVNRALESIGENYHIVRVARMRLNCNDVLESLLDELDVTERPNGMLQKFALFRRKLKKLGNSATVVLVVIEDSVRLGADTLAEIEALTAADAGESAGASLILMGNETLDTMLGEMPLARIQQRIRQRLSATALPLTEMHGYLRHCFRLAGREFEEIFEADAITLLHHLSGGIPRLVNNLVESAMNAAAVQGLDQVATTLLARVAENDHGLSTADFDPAAEPGPEDAATAIPKSDTMPAIPIPQLIQDTLPDLEILTPEPSVAATEAVVAANVNAMPECERDPTMAELRPDLDALELAMASAQDEDQPEPVTEHVQPLPELMPAAPQIIPEITLDHAISQRVASDLIDEPAEINAAASNVAASSASETDMPTLDLPRKRSNKADTELERIATELAKAKSIEDVDDKVAETLFGGEINFVAAQALAMPPSKQSANDAVARGEVAGASELAIFAPPTATQRLRTVRELNAKPDPVADALEAFEPAATPAAAPEHIEAPIGASMTQTLKALNVTPPVIGDDDGDENKGGFFSRFKKT